MSKDGEKRKRATGGPITGSHGWQRVDVGDELLIGAEEGGFMELEEFTPAPGSILGASDVPKHDVSVAEETKARLDGPKPDKKSQKKKPGLKEASSEVAARAMSRAAAEPKQQGSTAPEASAAEGPVSAAEGPVSDDVAALKVQLAKLQAENAALKGGNAPGKAADPNSARSAKLAAKRTKAKEIRRVKKKAAKARKLRAAARPTDQGAAL